MILKCSIKVTVSKYQQANQRQKTRITLIKYMLHEKFVHKHTFHFRTQTLCVHD